ncbi:MAG: AEC family transporter [SAR324 cluster bacterium]|nr:AEC family transporter [SAR324 cluster bacterium]MBL7035851.1 AEC family transporter [SAR324 cluster bacterium]
MFGPVIDIILPIFGILLIGYGTASLGWFDKSAVTGLTRYIFDFAVPMLLLRTLASTTLPDVIPWAYLASYYFGTLIVLVAGFALNYLFWHRSFSERVISAFSGCFSNTVLLGIPIIMLAFGEQAKLPLFIIIGTHGLVMIPVFTILLEMGKSGRAPITTMINRTLFGLITNPLIIGLLSGLACNMLDITLWKPLDEMAKLLGDSVTPGALFALGATLAGFRNNIRWQEVPVFVIMKTMLHPLAVWGLAVLVFDIKESLWIQVLVMIAAQPTGVNPFLFACRYNVGQSVSSGTVFLSTIISIFSLSILLAIFQ